MTFRFLIILLILSAGASSAYAAPAQLYGRSVIVGWTETRIQTTAVSAVPQSRTGSGQLSVYVSDKGRAFSRMTMSVHTPHGTRTGNRDVVQGDGKARSVNFHGNSMVIAMPRGDAGAMMITVTFDPGFQGCRAHVVMGKSGNAKSTHINSMATGRTYDLFSMQASGESCTVQSGNVFGT